MTRRRPWRLTRGSGDHYEGCIAWIGLAHCKFYSNIGTDFALFQVATGNYAVKGRCSEHFIDELYDQGVGILGRCFKPGWPSLGGGNPYCSEINGNHDLVDTGIAGYGYEMQCESSPNSTLLTSPSLPGFFNPTPQLLCSCPASQVPLWHLPSPLLPSPSLSSGIPFSIISNVDVAMAFLSAFSFILLAPLAHMSFHAASPTCLQFFAMNCSASQTLNSPSLSLSGTGGMIPKLESPKNTIFLSAATATLCQFWFSFSIATAFLINSIISRCWCSTAIWRCHA